MGVFGLGSMIAALALPKLLERAHDRAVMLAGAATMVAALLFAAVAMGVAALSWVLLLAVWLVVGLGYSAVLTPSGRLLRRSAHAGDRPALFAAQFALSHAWLQPVHDASRSFSCASVPRSRELVSSSPRPARFFVEPLAPPRCAR